MHNHLAFRLIDEAGNWTEEEEDRVFDSLEEIQAWLGLPVSLRSDGKVYSSDDPINPIAAAFDWSLEFRSNLARTEVAR